MNSHVSFSHKSLRVAGCIASVLMALFCLFAPHTAHASGPLDALSTAQQGIDRCDPDMFRRAVDIDATLNSGFDDALMTLQQEVASGRIGGDNALLAMAVAGLSSGDGKNMEIFKQLLLSEAKSFVTAGISGGHFAGKPNGKAASGAFSSLLKDISKERKQLVPGRVLSQKGEHAVISASLVDGAAGMFPLKLRLEQINGQWKVKEILNAKELLQDASTR